MNLLMLHFGETAVNYKYTVCRAELAAVSACVHFFPHRPKPRLDEVCALLVLWLKQVSKCDRQDPFTVQRLTLCYREGAQERRNAAVSSY